MSSILLSISRLSSRISFWFRSIFNRDRLESEMDAELRFHIESYINGLVESGVSPTEAARRARIEFGGLVGHKEDMRSSLGLRLLDELRADLRYAFRLLAKSPGFAAIAIVSLALGIGANATIFTLAKQLLIERLGVPHPEELRLFSWAGSKKVAVHNSWGEWHDLPDGRFSSTSFSYPVYQQLRAQNKVLEDLFAFKDIGRLNVTIDGSADVIQGELVSGNYYEQLKVQPQLGRPVLPADDAAPGASPVAVISDGFWSRAFGRSPSVIGKVIRLNLTPVTIVGVNPPAFTGAKTVQSSPDVFLPFSMQPIIAPKGKDGSVLTSDKLWWMLIMGRVKPGVSDATVQSSLDIALGNAARATLSPKKDETLPALIISDGSRGLNSTGRSFAQPVYVLMSLVGFVLLLACANIANLLLARSAARQREMNVRLALGASNGRILRQVLTESLLLSAMGGVAGLCLAYIGRNAIPQLFANPWERAELSLTFDWRVFAFTSAVTLLAGLLFGLAPAWQATRASVNSGLKENSQTSTRRTKGFAGKAIVAFQIAVSLLLVVGATLFLRTLIDLSSIDPGFNAKNIILFEINPPQSRYPGEKALPLHHRLEEELSAVPGVESVSLATVALISHSMDNTDFIPTGAPKTAPEEQVSNYNDVGEKYFETMNIPIVAGRGFNARDTETSPRVAVINQSLARKFFPQANPIGTTFSTSGDAASKDKLIQIVGICTDTRYSTLRDEPPPLFYRPYRQIFNSSEGPETLTYQVRTRLAPAAITPALRAAVQSVDADLPLVDVRTQAEQIEATMQQERVFAQLSSGFGLLALTLACVGIYGIMAYTVARRTNEIGIRLALGARPGQVRMMVLRETSWLALAGVVAGLAAALALTRFIQSMLYGLKPTDPFSLIGAALLLFAAAMLAAWLPARRASRVEPMQALRYE
jgi:predicted permease